MNNNFKIIESIDGLTKKYIFETYDKHRIETTYVDYQNKHIICFSTQVGCNLGCAFCYNGLRHNYKRNLTEEELLEQITTIIERENINDNKPILFSAMGIGEPLLNYDNLISCFNKLNSMYPDAKYALATTGVILNNILKLVDDLKNVKNFKLTISLHSANQQTRNKLMNINNNIIDLVNVVKKYKNLSGRKVEWNYVLFKDINDSKESAKELYELLGKNEYIKLNKFNPVSMSNLIASDSTKEFVDELIKYGMEVEIYTTNGSDINAACGQMISE